MKPDTDANQMLLMERLVNHYNLELYRAQRDREEHAGGLCPAAFAKKHGLRTFRLPCGSGEVVRDESFMAECAAKRMQYCWSKLHLFR